MILIVFAEFCGFLQDLCGYFLKFLGLLPVCPDCSCPVNSVNFSDCIHYPPFAPKALSTPKFIDFVLDLEGPGNLKTYPWCVDSRRSVAP